MKDISQSTNKTEIVLAIQQLNPNADISLGDPNYVTKSEKKFYSSIPADKLILPEGFYYDEKNGITNKHNTESGMYTCLRTEEIPKEGDIRLLPKHVKDVSQSTNIYEISEVVQQLNPYAEIRVGNKEYDSKATKRFYSSIPAESLNLPEGFSYDEKNGITNKHNTETGLYCSLDVEDLSLADERMLMPKVEMIEKIEIPSSEQEKSTVKEAIVHAIQKLKEKIKGDTNAKAR